MGEGCIWLRHSFLFLQNIEKSDWLWYNEDALYRREPHGIVSWGHKYLSVKIMGLLRGGLFVQSGSKSIRGWIKLRAG